VYNASLDYLQFVTYMRNLKGRNKVEYITNENQLKDLQAKH